jgi:hypothetical protein
MPFGDYIVVIEERTGVELARVTLSAEGSRPHAGEELVLRGEVYDVRKVRHVPHPENYSSRESTIAEVIVRRGSPPPSRSRPVSTSTTRAQAIVLPFTAPPTHRPVTSYYLPPALIAGIVAAGYSQQETAYGRARGGSCLLDDGRGCWTVIEVNDPSGLAARAAKACADLATFVHDHLVGRQPVAFIGGRYTNNVAPERAPSTAPTLDDMEGPTRNDRPPPTRPLRLVK